MSINNRSLANQRRFLAARILKRLQPHFWDSGYRKAIDPSKGILGGSRALRIWCPRDAEGKVIDRDHRLNGYVLETIQGVTEDGVMTDGFAGGLVTTYWHGIPIEDLSKLDAWLDRHLPAKAALPKAA